MMNQIRSDMQIMTTGQKNFKSKKKTLLGCTLQLQLYITVTHYLHHKVKNLYIGYIIQCHSSQHYENIKPYRMFFDGFQI